MSSVFLGQKNHLLSASSSNLSLEFSKLTFNLFQTSFSGDKPDSHFNKLSSIGSRAEEIGLHPDQRSTGTPPAVLDQNSVSQLSSLCPCAEAKGSLLKDVQDKSSSGPCARAVDCITNTPTVMNPALIFDLLSIDGSKVGFNGRLESTRKARTNDDD